MIIDKNNVIQSSDYQTIIKNDYKGLFYVRTKDIVNPLGFSFLAGENHPFTESVIEYAKNPTISIHHIFMKIFYKRFQPLSLGDAFFGENDSNHTLYQISPKTYYVPWFESMDMGGFGKGLDESHGSHFLGPVTDVFIAREFNRLKTIYDSIQQSGFDVSLQSDTIRGYFLKKGHSYKFVIVGGNHRVAVLNALGSDKIPVQLHPNRQHVIDYDLLDTLENVKNQSFTLKEAQAVFNAIYEGQKV